MSFSSDRTPSNSRARNRSTFGYWVPLALTVTVATIGLAAWVWSERRDGDDDEAHEARAAETAEDTDLSYGESETRPPPGGSGWGRGYAEAGPQAGPQEPGARQTDMERDDEGLMARMSGAIRRTPSPQQMFDTASRRVVAGMAAAGTAIGGALSSIREEGRGDFGDHERWEEEVERRRGVGVGVGGGEGGVQGALKKGERKKNVVVVVEGEEGVDGEHAEYASILSHLPPINPATTNLFILIHAPSLRSRSSPNQPPSLGSSYEAISTPGQTPAEELTSLDPQPYGSGSGSGSESNAYAAIHAQAVRLVQKPSMVMPFTTPSGHVHMLRHLAPDVVYLAEDLAGRDGELVEQIKGWVGQVMVVVGGASGAGLGGLVDTEDEGEKEKARDERGRSWWAEGEMVGLGKGVEVVDVGRMEDDFMRRVGGKE
ncbi:hypothetical protein K490DRAFT_73886 [Saccharata proteae CBS 121410]|uniref:Peroxin 22-like protein n=1 Tax=Saccharata proteae CBS 121410 TaxID=1314787 RepID=A0A9P4HW02_9PEZI|nr:hypothetical protein K490DRAFT_73886 [Saccharata proteae CBS 121410]